MGLKGGKEGRGRSGKLTKTPEVLNDGASREEKTEKPQPG